MSKDKLTPQSLEAEQSVLGGLLISESAIARVIDRLKPEHFYKIAHRNIYSAIVALFGQSQPVDVLTVSEKLKESDKLEGAGGRVYVSDLALGTVSAANIEHYADIILEKALLRDVGAAGQKIAELIYDDLEPGEVVDQAEQLIFKACERKTSGAVTPLGEIVLDSYGMIEERAKNKDDLSGLPSGFYDLDAITSGFQKSDLIIVAARPSMGKTAFCLNIAHEAAKSKGVPVAVFSLEMSKEQLVQRLLCSEAEVDSNRIRTGRLEDEDWTKLAVAMQTLSDVPVHIDDTSGLTVMDIRAKCRRLCAKEKNLGLIIIDYLQLMTGGDKKQNREQEISAISRGLKNLARELNVPIIALSQLSRALESRTNKRPMLSDLRESGAIEQDADVVAFIYREEYYDPDNADVKGKAEVIVAKQRNGPTGSVELLFQKNITKFRNPAKSKTDLYGGV